MRLLVSVLVVPVAVAIAVGIGWAIHGSGLGNVVPYYVIAGCIVGIAVSLVASREATAVDREPGDYIERVARRDAQSAAFADLVIVLLVSTVVFTIVEPVRGLSVYVPLVAVLAMFDAQVRQRHLNARYGA